jgi:hypothetical protein
MQKVEKSQYSNSHEESVSRAAIRVPLESRLPRVPVFWDAHCSCGAAGSIVDRPACLTVRPANREAVFEPFADCIDPQRSVVMADTGLKRLRWIFSVGFIRSIYPELETPQKRPSSLSDLASTAPQLMGREWSTGNSLRTPSDVFLAPRPPA